MNTMLNFLPTSLDKTSVGCVKIDSNRIREFLAINMYRIMSNIRQHLLDGNLVDGCDYFGRVQMQPPLSPTRVAEVICKTLVTTPSGQLCELYRCFDFYDLCDIIDMFGCEYYKSYYAVLALRIKQMISFNEYYDLFDCFGIQNCKSLINCRDVFNQTLSWAVPSSKAIQEICNFAAGELILEVGAGICFWAFLIRKAGNCIIASDNLSSHGSTRDNSFIPEMFVMDGVQAVQTHKTNVLFMCWPGFEDPMAVDSLRAFTGDKFIYIGEDRGGCTANDEFFDLLDKDWSKVANIDIPSWFGIYDSLSFYVRKPKQASVPEDEPNSVPVEEESWTVPKTKKTVKTVKTVKVVSNTGNTKSSNRFSSLQDE